MISSRNDVSKKKIHYLRYSWNYQQIRINLSLAVKFTLWALRGLGGGAWDLALYKGKLHWDFMIYERYRYLYKMGVVSSVVIVCSMPIS